MGKIYGNPIISPSSLKTLTITDASGNEFTGVVVGEKTLFTANRDDVKSGKVAASNEGVITGTMKDYVGTAKKLWIYIRTTNSEKTDSELVSLLGLTNEELLLCKELEE